MYLTQCRSCPTIAVLVLIVAPGCSDDRTSLQPTPTPEENTKEKGSTGPTKPAINLAAPPGWSRSEQRPLPTDDHGFTVAYEHKSGLAVTLYQFTRGHTSIPNDVNAALVKEELLRAKNGIELAVELGMWQDAEEKLRRIRSCWATPISRRCGLNTT